MIPVDIIMALIAVAVIGGTAVYVFFRRKETEPNLITDIKTRAYRPVQTGLKRKYVVMIGKKEADGFHVIHEIKAKEPIEKVTWQNKTYIVQPEKITFLRESVPYYVFDIESTVPIQLQHLDGADPEFIDLFVRRKALQQLVMSIKKQGFDWVTLLIGAIMGAAVGIVIGIYISPHIAATAAQTAAQAAQHITNTTTSTQTTFTFK